MIDSNDTYLLSDENINRDHGTGLLAILNLAYIFQAPFPVRCRVQSHRSRLRSSGSQFVCKVGLARQICASNSLVNDVQSFSESCGVCKLDALVSDLSRSRNVE